jgi:chloride channel protein, CIC family
MKKLRRLEALWRLWRVRWARVQMSALRLFVRLVPSERRRVFALTVMVGVFCGLAAVAFHSTISLLETTLVARAMNAPRSAWVFWTILTPTLGGLAGGALLQYVFPEARGSGIPQVKVAYAVRGGKLRFRDAVGKFFVGALQIGTGASLGREGPTVQICAGLASAAGQAMALSRENLRRLLPVGAAAGIAAAFNAPIAAVTFAIEEVVGDLDQTLLSGVIVAAALAAAIERMVLGEHPVFDVPAGYGLHHTSSLFFYALLGLAAAPVSLAFTESLLYLRKRFQRLSIIPAWARPGVGGLVTGTLAVVALAWLKTGGVTGGGYDTLSEALSGKLVVHVLLALCAMKLVATVFSYSSGGAGGIFAPALFIGGMLGGVFGFLDVRLLGHAPVEVGAFALVGMGAVFAGIVRAPITSVLIIFEMTNGYGLILPLMLANMTSYGLARRIRPTPIYEALLVQDGIRLPHRGGHVSHALERLRAAEAMTTEPVTLEAEADVADAVKHVERYDYSAFPVLDERGGFVGLVSRARLRRTLAEGGGTQKVRQLVDSESRAHVRPEDPLVRAVVRMTQAGARQLAVLDGEGGQRLVGILTMTDIVRVQARAALGASGEVEQPGVREVSFDEEAAEVEPARGEVEDVRVGGDGDAA